jgi:DNA-binding MarR family transcriptional regulator
VASAEDPIARLARDCHILSLLCREVLEDGYLLASGADISFSQLNLLKFLQARKARAVGDVMRFLGASYSATSHAIQRLKKKKLVKTGGHPDDRRAQLVSLTPAGRKLVTRYEKTKFTRLARLLSDTPKADLDAWGDSIEKVIDALLREKVITGETCLQCGAYLDHCIVHDRRCRAR